MAHIHTWDDTFNGNPQGSDSPTEGDNAIRATRVAVDERAKREHFGSADTNALQGRLREGACRVYFASTAPTAHPDTVALDSNDEGRLWFKYASAVDSGTTTSTTSNKLVQTTQNFLTTVTVGDLVVNTTDNTHAFVTDVDSNTTLSLSSDIMTTAEAFSIYDNYQIYVYNGSQWIQIGLVDLTSDQYVGGIKVFKEPFVGAAQLYHLQHKISGNGGSTADTTWNTRPINTEVTSQISGASLSSNQITLPAGTYFIDWWSCVGKPTLTVGHQTRFRNITDSTSDLLGSTESLVAYQQGVTATSSGSGILSITAEKVFELQHFTTYGYTTYGFGVGVTTGEDNIFADIKIWRTS